MSEREFLYFQIIKSYVYDDEFVKLRESHQMYFWSILLFLKLIKILNCYV